MSRFVSTLLLLNSLAHPMPGTAVARTGRSLCIVVTGATPSRDVGKLVNTTQALGWKVRVISTPDGLLFINTDELAEQTRASVRSIQRKPHEPRDQLADAVIVAPATSNTICKLGHGVTDTYAHSFVSEAIGAGIPVIILPSVKACLANRLPFKRSVEILRDEGVVVLLDAEAPDAGGPYPWGHAVEALANHPRLQESTPASAGA